jgi:hypothetical protein
MASFRDNFNKEQPDLEFDNSTPSPNGYTVLPNAHSGSMGCTTDYRLECVSKRPELGQGDTSNG